MSQNEDQISNINNNIIFRNLRSTARRLNRHQHVYPVHANNLMAQMRDAERRRASMTPNAQTSPQRVTNNLAQCNLRSPTTSGPQTQSSQVPTQQNRNLNCEDTNTAEAVNKATTQQDNSVGQASTENNDSSDNLNEAAEANNQNNNYESTETRRSLILASIEESFSFHDFPELQSLFMPSTETASNSARLPRLLGNPADVEFEAIQAIQNFQLQIQSFTEEVTTDNLRNVLPLFASAMRSIFPVYILHPQLIFAPGSIPVDENEYASRISTLNLLSPHTKTVLEDLSSKCVICQIEFELNQDIRSLICNHKFHVACIDTWIKTAITCPVCRRGVDGNSVNQDSSRDPGITLRSMDYVLDFLIRRQALTNNNGNSNTPSTSTHNN